VINAKKRSFSHYFEPSYGFGFTPQKWLFLAKFSPLQNLKVAIYKGFVILGRQK
jgi:predicted membrane protein